MPIKVPHIMNLSENNNKLKIALFQMDLLWENPQGNLANVKKAITETHSKFDFDIFLLPEMFTTGFSMEAQRFAWSKSSKEIKDLQKLSKRFDCAIGGSVWFLEAGKYYNRLLWITPCEVLDYDKRHLFSLVGEEKHLSSGLENPIWNYKNWKIKPQVCYDLRFPRESRNDHQNPYDLLIYVANWPERRIQAWETLLKARAIENQSYVIGVNRVGEEPNEIKYNGNSIVVDYFGNTMVQAEDFQEQILICELEKNTQHDFREKFPFIQDEL